MRTRSAPAAVLVALFLGYASFYLCRSNLEAAMPLLVHDGFDKTRLGQLSSIATLTYAVGKVVLGAAGDAVGGRRLMGLAVAGSVVFSFAFGAAGSFGALVVFAAANRFFQSGGWSAVVHVASRQFPPAVHGRVMGFLATSYELGAVGALALSSVVARSGWRALFVINPLLLALVGGAVVAWLPRRDPRAGSGLPAVPPSPSRPSAPADTPDEPARFTAVARQLFARGDFWTLVALSALLTFLRVSFLTWTPTYLYELSKATGAAEVSGAIVKSALFPAAGVVAALGVGALSDVLGPGRRAPIMAVSLAFVVVLVLALGHPLSGRPHGTLAAAGLIAAVGLFLLGPYSLLAGAMALDVAGRRGTATAAGMIDGAGYVGATASGWALGRIADRAGWSSVFDVLAAAALAACLVSSAWAIVVLRRRAGAG